MVTQIFASSQTASTFFCKDAPDNKYAFDSRPPFGPAVANKRDLPTANRRCNEQAERPIKSSEERQNHLPRSFSSNGKSQLNHQTLYVMGSTESTGSCIFELNTQKISLRNLQIHLKPYIFYCNHAIILSVDQPSSCLTSHRYPVWPRRKKRW